MTSTELQEYDLSLLEGSPTDWHFLLIKPSELMLVLMQLSMQSALDINDQEAPSHSLFIYFNALENLRAAQGGETLIVPMAFHFADTWHEIFGDTYDASPEIADIIRRHLEEQQEEENVEA